MTNSTTKAATEKQTDAGMEQLITELVIYRESTERAVKRSLDMLDRLIARLKKGHNPLEMMMLVSNFLIQERMTFQPNITTIVLEGRKAIYKRAARYESLVTPDDRIFTPKSRLMGGGRR